MTAWQPIETAPKDGTLIVAVVNCYHTLEKHTEQFAVVFFNDGNWVSEHPLSGGYDPTHWMTLPDPPQ